MTYRFCGLIIFLCIDMILAGVMTPNITDAPPGSDANKLGQAAWGVRTILFHHFNSSKMSLCNISDHLTLSKFNYIDTFPLLH